jgi:hypothetical protein
MDTLKVYGKEEWYQECRRHKPDLTRPDFHRRWVAIWHLAEFMGVVIDTRTSSQN